MNKLIYKLLTGATIIATSLMMFSTPVSAEDGFNATVEDGVIVEEIDNSGTEEIDINYLETVDTIEMQMSQAEASFESYEDLAYGNIISAEDLLEGYLYYDQPYGAQLYASSYNGSKLTGVNKIVYDEMRKQVAEIAAGERSSSVISVNISSAGYSGEMWTAAELGISSIVENVDGAYYIRSEAGDAVKSMTGYDPALVWRTVLRDCPYEMYWAGLSCNYGGGYKCTYDYYMGEWVIGLPDTVTIKLAVSYDYVGSDTYVVNTSKTKSVQYAKNNALAIISEASGLSDMEKIKYYVNRICGLNEYNHAALDLPSSMYGNPWQMIYVFDGDTSTNVVCEGYSKAFQFLMNNTNFSNKSIYSYIVSGNMNGGGHMWNIIHMPDGKNYLMDVTNCDSGSTGIDYFYIRSADSGSVGAGYIFYRGSSPVTYVYDQTSKTLYSNAELTISGTKYVVKTVDRNKAQAFVKRLYNDCLGREAESAGLKSWTDQLCAGNIDGATIGAGFVFSDEYMNKGTTRTEYIKMLYKVFMGREADEAGLKYWKSQMNAGKTREDVFKGFVESAEYTQICSASGIERGTYRIRGIADPTVKDKPVKKATKNYVERIYVKALGRASDPEGIAYWSQQISNENWDPVAVAEYFILSPEFEAKKLSNKEYVKVLYRTFMGREADEAGLNYWLGELKKGQSRARVLERFAGCEEFQTIVKSFGL